MVTQRRRRTRMHFGLLTTMVISLLGCASNTGGVSVEPLPPLTVTIVPEGTFPISPTDPTAIVIPANSTVQFHAVTAQGTRVDQLVSWSIRPHGSDPNPPLGSISQLGLFQAPNAASSIAISALDLPGQAQAYRGFIFVEIKL